MKGVPYSEALGLVLWSTVVLHLDTAYAVGILSQFMQNLGQVHWKRIKRVINYLGHTKDLWLTFGGKKQEMLEGYCDANWVSQLQYLDIHFIMGWV
jgi:phenylalanine-4-hydroxylase